MAALAYNQEGAAAHEAISGKEIRGIGDVEETVIEGVSRYSYGGIRVYRIPVESFPNHVTNVYLLVGGEPTLVDVGFNSETGRNDLERGFAVVCQGFGERVSLESVSNVVITHGHGDHFGMLEHPRLKGKRLFMSPPDTEVVREYQTEYQEWKQYVAKLAQEAGCQVDLDQLFGHDRLAFDGSDYQLIEVHDQQEIIGSGTVHHTPGHSPGHICLGCGPFLFLGDHLLSLTTPHQVPKSGWGGAGLRVYLDSLAKVARLGYALGLPAHEEVITSIEHRAKEVALFHQQRLAELHYLCRQEKSLYELTRDYYARHPELIQASSIDELVAGDFVLALEEIKAHVEYLLDEGRLLMVGGESGVPRYRSR
ncbi:MAG: MBL fold metallo-hydrolase [Dehalococcoidia bacterium]|nr:MBL fold metallo-hydrolase [Dehalococcoidia bacterium]